MSKLIQSPLSNHDQLISQFTVLINNSDLSEAEIVKLSNIVHKLGYANKSLREVFTRCIINNNFTAYQNITHTAIVPEFSDILEAAKIEITEGKPNIFEHMLDNYPYCDFVSDKKGRTPPFVIACKHQSLNVIKKAYALFKEQQSDLKIEISESDTILCALNVASSSDNIDVFCYLLDILKNINYYVK